jgi:hypothetical protein
MDWPISDAARLRALVCTPHLLALCERTGQGPAPLVTGGRLVVLTDEEHVHAFEEAEAALAASKRLTLQPIDDGIGIFAHFPETVKRIHLDPGTPGEDTLTGSRLAALRDMARATAAARVAASPSAYDAPTFRRIMREHRSFVVPLQPVAAVPVGREVTALHGELHNGGVTLHEILHFKRPDGTHYAVVFTSPDCAEAFFAALGQRTPTATLDGARLFAELRKLEERYGVTSIVFDMEGPARQSWMRIGAWRIVLE